jgi:hypothetical protein
MMTCHSDYLWEIVAGSLQQYGHEKYGIAEQV